MHFERRFTQDGTNPYDKLAFRFATSEIRNPDGTIVFRAENVEIPEQFSQVATDILFKLILKVCKFVCLNGNPEDTDTA